MERFVIIIKKCSVLDVAAALNPPLNIKTTLAWWCNLLVLCPCVRDPQHRRIDDYSLGDCFCDIVNDVDFVGIFVSWASKFQSPEGVQ